MGFDWKSLLPKEATDFLKSISGDGRPPKPSLPESSFSNSNFSQLFAKSPKDREAEDTKRLYLEAKALATVGPFGTPDLTQRFVMDLVIDVCAEHGHAPSEALGQALWDTVCEFLVQEGIVFEFTLDEPPPNLTLEEAAKLRKILRTFIAFQKDHRRLLPLFRHKIEVTLAGILGHFPPSAFVDVGEDGQALDDSILLPKASALAMADDIPTVVERSLMTFFDDDIVEAHVFEEMRLTLERNLDRASGIPPDGRQRSNAKWVLPSEHRIQDAGHLVTAYLGGTPLETFFNAGLPFAIPFPARFEHTHIMGGSGHGKTQLMQFLIHHDLVRAKQDQRSVIVIDSQGDLIRTIANLEYFSPDVEGSLADRFVMIDPSDIEHPIALNMFDFNRSRLSGFAPLDREKILNATVELYEYFFGALLGAELTQRQGLIFRYIGRLLIEIPGATIHTLRELMEDGEKFLPYMEKLTGTTRAFFATRFFDPTFRETKKQILSRLWGVLANSALERMFSHKESKVDIFDLMNSGKIIFINTAKDLLGQDGAAIFGRFFVALIAQAAVQRSAVPAHERNPCFVYIDEAQDYFDSNIGNLLTQARKYKVGLILAHQKLDDLGAELRGSVLANTTIKFAGGISAKDATAVAQELRTESGFVLAQKRGAKETHFACFVRNFTGSAISVSIPLGYVERQERLCDADAEYLREVNRDRYSAPPELAVEVSFTKKADTAPKPKVTPAKAEAPPNPQPISPIEPTATPKPKERPKPPVVEADPGKGGQEHKYLQHLIKRLAEERGFRATIEENILDGKGQVDVSLSLGKRRIACEISVTTSRDHELENIEKCLAAGYSEIVLVGATERHSKGLAKFIEENLEEGHKATIRYASPESLVEYLDGLGAPAKPAESTVRGYKVKTTTARQSPEDAAKRRATLAGVIAKSISKKK